MNEKDKEQVWKIKTYINQKIERLEKQRKNLSGGAKMLCSKQIKRLEKWLEKSHK